MSYYSLYNYRCTNDKDVRFSRDTACFRAVFAEVNVEEINIFLLYGNPNIGRIKHNTVHNKQDLDLFFESLKDVTLAVPTIYELDGEQLAQEIGDNIEDIKDYEFDTSKALKVSFNVKGMSNKYIRLLCTLTRYFYEEEYKYKGIIDEYLKHIVDPKYAAIPRIELFQLAHSGHSLHGGHMLFSNYGINTIVPVKTEDVCRRLNDKNYYTLNSIFEVTTTPRRYKINEVLDNYLTTL